MRRVNTSLGIVLIIFLALIPLQFPKAESVEAVKIRIINGRSVERLDDCHFLIDGKEIWKIKDCGIVKVVKQNSLTATNDGNGGGCK